MGLLDSIGRMLGKKDRESEAVFPYQAGYKASDQPAAPAPAPAAPAAAQSAGSAAPAAFVSLGSMGLGAAEPPKRRQVVQAFATVTTLGANDRPAITGRSSGDTCKFLVDRPVFAGRSWFFAGPGVTQGSPLAEKLFAIPELDSVLIDDSTLSVTRKTKDGDWKSLATQIGALIRAQLESSEPAVATSIAEKIPGETEIRDQIQRVIDLEVNPGVATHSGHISLTAVRGNSVYIKMGGGCQGCSAADLTLKEGIHRSFRSAVPFVGAIYDETDHKAGLNPYFR